MGMLSRKLYCEIEKALEQDSERLVDSLPVDIVCDEDVLCFGAIYFTVIGLLGAR